jgi:ribose/xylose/arabinose/galactoside ABC-type transport system permease subunit
MSAQSAEAAPSRLALVFKLFVSPAGIRREVFLLAITLVLIIVIPFLNPYFFRLANLQILLLANSHLILIAIGMGLLLIVGEIDLSVGSTMALAGVVAGVGMKQFGLPIPVALVAAMAAALVVGLINAFFIVKVGVNFLIMTLATMGIVRGVVIVISEAGVAFLPPSFNWIGQSQLLGFAIPIWISLGLALVVGVILAKNYRFRQIYFVGGNRQAARLVGLPVDRIRMSLYVGSALLAGLAGVLNTARFGSAMPTAGIGVELPVIAACVLGGSSLAGGQGTIFGVVVGVLFLGLVSNVLVMLNISTFWHDPINGAVLIFAITLDIVVTRWRNERRRRALLSRSTN